VADRVQLIVLRLEGHVLIAGNGRRRVRPRTRLFAGKIRRVPAGVLYRLALRCDIVEFPLSAPRRSKDGEGIRPTGARSKSPGGRGRPYKRTDRLRVIAIDRGFHLWFPVDE